MRADLNMGSGKATENRPEDRNGAPGTDAAGHRNAENDDKNERRDKKDRDPEQKKRQPDTGHVEMRRVDLEDSETWNHLRASNARMASAGVISPFWSRARMSVRISGRVGE